jgi:hypothetical protein
VNDGHRCSKKKEHVYGERADGRVESRRGPQRRAPGRCGSCRVCRWIPDFMCFFVLVFFIACERSGSGMIQSGSTLCLDQMVCNVVSYCGGGGGSYVLIPGGRSAPPKLKRHMIFFCKICRNSSFLVLLETRSRNITTTQMILFFNFFIIFFYFSRN